jgi:hypothetical protein
MIEKEMELEDHANAVLDESTGTTWLCSCRYGDGVNPDLTRIERLETSNRAQNRGLARS